MTVGPIRRRTFIVTLGSAAAWPVATRAQQPTQMPRVGWIWPGASAGNQPEVAGFKQGLRELGYVEGRNIVVEYRFGEHSEERLGEIAADLARLNVSVIWAGGMSAFRAVRRAAPDTPIVYIGADPMGAGIVTNLRWPGGNMTGVSILRVAGKWPELAREVLPALSRVGYLFNPTNASSVSTLSDARRSVEALGMDFRSYPIERPEDLQRVFDAMTRDDLGVLLLDATHPYPTNWPRVAELALSHKLPAISEGREFVAAGGLMSYGASIFDICRRTATYVDKILKGAKAGDLPVEQPTKFELAINLKTAKALGLTIPPSLIMRADEVIE
jgi:putative tryptophan/tyrosine transport system substrate-binding protein